MLVEIDQPIVGNAGVRLALKLSETPGEVYAPAMLGSTRASVREVLGYSHERSPSSRRA
jgi:hypothetical protein